MTDNVGVQGRAGGASPRDFIELLGQAIATGIATSLVLALLALGLAGNAQAQPGPDDARTGTLLLRALADGAWQPAPKVETDVAIHVTGIVARTRVAQTFHNPGADWVDALYVFPLPGNAAVDRMRLRVGERVIEGQVREREEARRVYADARREGRKASLVEQQRPNLFTNAVANVGPGETVRVVIEYQQTLAWEDGEYRLRFPLAVTPRYEPADGGAPLLQPDHAPGEANLVAIGVIIDSPAPLARVSTTYHETVTEKESATRTVVTFRKEQELADRDFELVFAPQPGTEPAASVFTETVNGNAYSLLMVVPPAAGAAGSAPLPRETVFVIDTSGSMQGAPIAQARQALLEGLNALTPRDRFNVAEFNSVTRPMWPDALPATPDNVRHAREWVARLKAGGGTEMAAALTFALHGRDTPGYLRQVIFMTDGAVGNEDPLFRLIAQRLASTRLFTVGIGSAPNSHFMAKAAQFGRGTFTYVGDLREVREKMTRLFAKIEAPVIRDLTIRWPDGTAVETYPARIPDLYLGEPLVVAAAHSARTGTILVSGTRGNQPWSVALTPTTGTGPTGVGALWARSRIASLMDELRLGADEAAIRPEVLKVALEHHLVSRYTSLVAVDVTPTAPAGEKRTALVKATPPHGTAAGELPQTGTEGTLQMILGLFALLAAGSVALVARRLPDRPARSRGVRRTALPRPREAHP